MRRTASTLCFLFLTLTWCGLVTAQNDFPAPLLGTGHYERVDDGGECANDPNFVAGVYDAVTQLQVAGNSAGCDSEWGAFAEFDYADIGSGNVVLSATLVLRYTGYGDDTTGLPYVGVYGYEYAGGPVVLPRDQLTDQTALAIFAPTGTTNVDFELDVTDYVVDLVEEEIFQTGFFVCGVFSEVGYDTLVYFGGSSHAHAPRLIITTEDPVQNQRCSWGKVKALYR